jgi:hypothetical protein
MKILILISILFLTSCHTTYYWYSAEADKMLSRQTMYLYGSDGQRIDYRPVKVLPDGTRYTMMCYSRKGANWYLWVDKVLVKKEKTPEELVRLNKKSDKLLRKIRKLRK